MKNKFRNSVIVLCLLTSMSFISCGDVNIDSDDVTVPTFPFRNTDFEAEEPFSSEVEVGNRSLLRLQGINDQITITGISGANSVMITGIKHVGSDSIQDAEEHLGELQVNVQSLANEVFVETIHSQDPEGRNYVVEYTITLPKNFEVQVTNANGTVTLDSIEHDVTVNNGNGEVIFIGIVARVPVASKQVYDQMKIGELNPIVLIASFGIFVAIVAFVILEQQGQQFLGTSPAFLVVRQAIHEVVQNIHPARVRPVKRLQYLYRSPQVPLETGGLRGQHQ